jgi:hypothetical protein
MLGVCPVHKRFGCICRTQKLGDVRCPKCGEFRLNCSCGPVQTDLALPSAQMVGLYQLKPLTSSVEKGHSHKVSVFVNPPGTVGDGGTVVAFFQPSKDHVHVASVSMADAIAGVKSSYDVGHAHVVKIPSLG